MGLAEVQAISSRRLAEAMRFDPALGYPAPDVEALVWFTLNHLDEDPGAEIVVWTVVSIPVPGPTGWAVAATIQVDVRDQSKRAAFRRADIARRLVLALPAQTWLDGVVNDVTVVTGPAWLPDYDTGKPRYTTQFVVQVHPREGATP